MAVARVANLMLSVSFGYGHSCASEEAARSQAKQTVTSMATALSDLVQSQRTAANAAYDTYIYGQDSTVGGALDGWIERQNGFNRSEWTFQSALFDFNAFNVCGQ